MTTTNMNAAAAANFIEPDAGRTPSKGVVGMTCLIVAESAIFTIFVVAYLYYLGKDLSGPTPQQVLELPILNSICLLSSSATITFAVNSLRRGDARRFGFWWLATILLGAYFLLGTGREWHHLIYDKGLTIQTNLFGTTFYSLVGLHATHVIVGLLALLMVMAFAITGSVKQAHTERAHVLALYWHFVDAVWIVVFTVVYLIGR
jgi:cytochrome c oxidase subunit 3